MPMFLLLLKSQLSRLDAPWVALPATALVVCRTFHFRRRVRVLQVKRRRKLGKEGNRARVLGPRGLSQPRPGFDLHEGREEPVGSKRGKPAPAATYVLRAKRTPQGYLHRGYRIHPRRVVRRAQNVKAGSLFINLDKTEAMDIIPARDNLQKRGIYLLPPLCPMCNTVDESLTHLFICCSMSTEVRAQLQAWWKDIPGSLEVITN
ncbi:hypothetical protein LXL04_033023 [Taraxacum kok-saghyz]